MSHSFQSHLDEYQVAIDHLAPTVPSEIKAQAQQWHDALMANSDATEEEIDAAMAKTGMAEYPHRHAFNELTAGGVEKRRVEITLEHVEPDVAAKVKKLTESGVTMQELTNSKLFESEFTPEERHQVEDALLDADIHIKEEFGKNAASDEKVYAKLVAKYEKRRDAISAKIDALAALAKKDEKWAGDILAKVERFREGFLVTEPDVTLEEVEKEVEYWTDTMAAEEAAV